MNSTKILSSIATGVAAAALAFAAPAQASEAELVEHAHDLGIVASDESIIDVGDALCNALRQGASLAMVQAVAQNGMTAKGYSIDDANRFVAYAVTDMC